MIASSEGEFKQYFYGFEFHVNVRDWSKRLLKRSLDSKIQN